MANSNSLLNIASLLLNNLDVTSIMKTMLNKVDMGQLGGALSGVLGSGSQGNSNSNPPAAEAAAPSQPPSNTGSFLPGFNINSFTPPIQTINPQAMSGMFSQMFGGAVPMQGYQMQQPYYYMDMNQGFSNPYPNYNYYGGYYVPPSEDL